LSYFNLANNLESLDKYITFINTNELLFSSVITDTSNSAELLKFYDNSLLNFSNKYVHLNIFGFRNLLDQIEVAGTEKYFTIPAQDMPIPIENIMIFRDIDGKKYFAHDIQLKLYYPNIYEVLNNTNNDNLTMYIFYADDTRTIGLQYKNQLSLYYKYTSNILNKYKDNTIPDIIKNYSPIIYSYDFDDYDKSLKSPDHFTYKNEKLKSWIDQENEVFRAYLYHQIKLSDSFYIDLTNVDLASKHRLNNHQEILDTLQQEIFDEARYVFIFRKEFIGSTFDLKIFIDGKFYFIDKKFEDDLYRYYYIPTKLIKNDSILEIEKHGKYLYSLDVTFSSLDEKKSLNYINNMIHVNVNDVFFIRADNGLYIDRTKFNFFKDVDGVSTLIDREMFTDLNGKIIVSVNDNSLLNVQLKLCIKKNCQTYGLDIPYAGFATESLQCAIETENLFNYFRIVFKIL
jgi:Mor family transcriptional regulator